MDGVNGEISMNPNDQCGLCTFVFFNLSKRNDHKGEVLKF